MTGTRRQNHKNDVGEWRLKPLDDHSHQQQQQQESSSSSSSNPDESYYSPPITSNSLNLGQPTFNSSRKSKRVSKNHRVKPEFVKKSEMGEVGQGLSSELSELNVCDNNNNNYNKEKGKEKEEEKSECEEVDVIARLEDLCLCVVEPELSEEQIKINDQLQEDELLAMESIYGENILVLDQLRGLRSFQIYIDIEAPNETVTTKLNSSSDPNTGNESSGDFSYSFKVLHLPPIMLSCVLPRSYPSHIPPHFTVSVQWLNSDRISSLCTMLDSIWAEQTGQEVIYQWVEWLQSLTLSHLGFDEEILLGPYGMKKNGDMRAISGSISPDIDIPSLKSYNNAKRHENFCKNLHECCICYSEYIGTDFARLPCQHFFCLKCMKTYSDMHIAEGTVSKLQCPDVKCGGMVPPYLLKRILGDEDFERWETLMLQKTLDSMSDVAYCPRCETPCIEDEDQHAQCSKCFFSFCSICREKRHVGVACVSPDLKLQILRGRQSSSQLNNEQKRKERDMINDLLSVKEALSDAKQCPSCKMAISKKEGCNKMVCSNCGTYFCYLCNKAIDGYEHFRDGACELFPQLTMQQWEDRMANIVPALVQIQFQGDMGNVCPNCRQLNAKVGNNNHILCWSCQNHYCYLCRKVVRRSSQHYGPKGCKQHSA